MVKALLIEFDSKTGKRAGNINPRDSHLVCHGWQNLESTPAREIRLVDDDRSIEAYHNIPGVVVLSGKDEINVAIESLVPSRHKIVSESLMLKHLEQKGINLDVYAGQELNVILEDLYSKGVMGIVRRLPIKVE